MSNAELNRVRAQTFPPRRNNLVIRVQDRNVARRLIAKDVVLRSSVIHQRLITVHMIRRYVQHGCHCRMKVNYGFQLEAGKLNHVPTIIAR